MPQYSYKCTNEDCDYTLDLRCKIAERKEPEETPCPKCSAGVRMVLGVATVVSGVTVTDKRPDGWRDVLSKVHKGAGRTSTVNT